MACYAALPHITSSTFPHAGELRIAGFQLLPSFGRPHYTVRLSGDDRAELARLVDALGPAQANKYHR